MVSGLQEHGGDGFHMNGGAWMGLGGLDVWSHLIANDYERAEVLIRLMVDMQKNHYLQDQGGRVRKRQDWQD